MCGAMWMCGRVDMTVCWRECALGCGVCMPVALGMKPYALGVKPI